MMSECHCMHWFLRKVLRNIVQKHHDTIYMGRLIFKHLLYRDFSQWYHFRREETREVLDMLCKTFKGINLVKHGLRIPSCYLSMFQKKTVSEDEGNGPSEVSK